MDVSIYANLGYPILGYSVPLLGGGVVVLRYWGLAAGAFSVDLSRTGVSRLGPSRYFFAFPGRP